MSTMTAMNNRQVCKLMREWGFTEAGGSGGHIIMRHLESDKRVQVTAPGRRTPTPEAALRKAAQIVGVPLHAFKQGPPKPTTITVGGYEMGEFDIDLRSDPPESNGNGHTEVDEQEALEGEIADDDAAIARLLTKRRRRPSAELLAMFRAAPNVRLTVQEMADRTGLIPQSQISPALPALKAKHPELEKIARGLYVWNEERPPVEERTVEDVVDEARLRARTFEKVTADAHGRVFLRDHEGHMWVAIKVEPTFFPMGEATSET